MQPDGKYSVWGSISGSFLLTGATRQEIIDFKVAEAKERASENTKALFDQIESGKNPYYQFKVEWQEAVASHNRKYPEQAIS